MLMSKNDLKVGSEVKLRNGLKGTVELKDCRFDIRNIKPIIIINTINGMIPLSHYTTNLKNKYSEDLDIITYSTW